MALTPLEVEVLNTDGSPAAAATIELRSGLGTKPTVSGYNQDGSVMTPPILTNSAGGAVTWLPNTLYEWRATGAVTSEWRAFRAYAGFGAEGIYESGAVGVATPTSSTITVPSHGIDDPIGGADVTVDFAHDHLAHLQIMLLRSSEALLRTAVTVASGETGVSLEVEYRNPITGASPTIYDSGGSVITPPYMTNSGTGNFEGYARHDQGIVQWRIPDSTLGLGYEDYSLALSTGRGFTLGGVSLFDGFEMVGGADQAFDGTLTFTTAGSDWSLGDTIVDGQRLNLSASRFTGMGAGDDWTLAVADLADPATTGQLDAWLFELIPV